MFRCEGFASFAGTLHRAIGAAGAQVPYKDKVGGSNPSSPTSETACHRAVCPVAFSFSECLERLRAARTIPHRPPTRLQIIAQLPRRLFVGHQSSPASGILTSEVIVEALVLGVAPLHGQHRVAAPVVYGGDARLRPVDRGRDASVARSRGCALSAACLRLCGLSPFSALAAEHSSWWSPLVRESSPFSVLACGETAGSAGKTPGRGFGGNAHWDGKCAKRWNPARLRRGLSRVRAIRAESATVPHRLRVHSPAKPRSFPHEKPAKRVMPPRKVAVAHLPCNRGGFARGGAAGRGRRA